ncbi:MAG: sulfotransferase family protein [Chloroflexi bacterium]|nr:sulfotransferase family protein [Chloroflexota bacterium]
MTTVTIFLHIPKTGGSTLHAIHMRLRGPAGEHTRVVDTPDIRHNIATAADLLRAPDAPYDTVWGHFHYGVHTASVRPHRYATLLRDPAQRVLSEYFHVLRDADHPAHERYHRLPPEEAIAQITPDVQTKILAGVLDPATPADLETAKQRLAGEVAFGLLERFDESLVLLRRTFGWGMPFYRRRNVGRNRPRQSDPALLALAAERNPLDRALLAFAAELFAERTAALGWAFRREVALLRAVNPVVGRAAALRDRLSGG